MLESKVARDELQCVVVSRCRPSSQSQILSCLRPQARIASAAYAAQSNCANAVPRGRRNSGLCAPAKRAINPAVRALQRRRLFQQQPLTVTGGACIGEGDGVNMRRRA